MSPEDKSAVMWTNIFIIIIIIIIFDVVIGLYDTKNNKFTADILVVWQAKAIINVVHVWNQVIRNVAYEEFVQKLL